MSLKERQAAIVSDFAIFDDKMDRYDYIIDLGKEMPALAEEYKTEDNIVKGCQSKVWLRAYTEGDKVRYQADSNTVITKGLIALLVRVLDNATAQEIVNAELTFVEDIDLKGHLSSQRSNGFSAMIQKMKDYAQSVLDGSAENTSEEPAAVFAAPRHEGEIKSDAIGRIQTVFDPEIPVNVWDLGLIYEVTVFPPLNNVYVLMTVTAPNCPVADTLPVEVKEAVKKVEGVGAVEVELTFDPPWTKDMMSEVAKLELDMF